MVKIKIIAIKPDLCAPFSFWSSIKVEITDENTKETYPIVYVSSLHSAKSVTYMKKTLNSFEKLPGTRVITLYSDKDFSEFIKRYEKKFSSRNDFNCYTKNCASAGEFVLDYFFPEPTCDNYLYTGFRTVLGVSCLLTCGMFNCTPSLPCFFDTPRDTYVRAKLLVSKYGKKPEETKLELTETKEESKSIPKSTTAGKILLH